MYYQENSIAKGIVYGHFQKIMLKKKKHHTSSLLETNWRQRIAHLGWVASYHTIESLLLNFLSALVSSEGRISRISITKHILAKSIPNIGH